MGCTSSAPAREVAEGVVVPEEVERLSVVEMREELRREKKRRDEGGGGSVM